MKIGVYPGSFDPFTVGHLDILTRASALLDEVIVAVLVNTAKRPIFTPEERESQIAAAVRAAGLTNVRTGSFSGLTVDYAMEMGASCLVRGLRTVADYEYESQLSAMNRRLAPGIDTLCLLASPEHAAISSGIVREIGIMGGSIAGLVPEVNHHSIKERLAQHAARIP